MVEHKEKNEIMSKLRQFILSPNFDFNYDEFQKDPLTYLKNTLLSNPDTFLQIQKIKDKINNPLQQNLNMFSLLAADKKQRRETEMTAKSLFVATDFLIDEPSFIVSLNKRIYSKYLFQLKSKDGALARLLNGSLLKKQRNR